jgi:NitT/TauT family transport system substrate-binding protein
MRDHSRRAFLRTIAILSGAMVAGCSQAAPAPPTAAPAPPPTSAAAPTSAPAAPAPAPTTAPTVSTKPASLTPLKLVWVALTANQMLWPVAKEAGYFEKYGIDADLTYLQGSQNAVPALMSKDIDMASVAGSAVISAQAGGSDLVMVAGFLNIAIFRIMAQPEFSKVEDLKGKTVAVTRVGNADYFAWQTIIARLGWKESDLTYVNSGDVNGQVTLLKTGDVQAISVSPPNNVLAESVGAHQILDSAELKEPEQNVGVAVTHAYLADHGPVIQNMLKASIEAMARWKKDPAFIKSVINKYLKSEDPRFSDVGYDAYANVWPQAPYPTREGIVRVIEQVAAQNPRAKDLDPDKMFDSTNVKAVEDSGFIKQIYG